VTPDDEEMLVELFTDPSVAEWWGDPATAVSDAMETSDDESHYVIEVDGDAVGMIQTYEESDPMYRHAAVDIALRSRWQGRGIGSDAIRTLARYLIDECGHHRLTIDPAAHNERAIRAYRRVGFRPVGVMREYELGPDGDWHDGLLMDLLAGELRD
jgi:aminoglycoside 6'-N-acetyltransferase